VLICCERKILLVGWCWIGIREKHCWLRPQKASMHPKISNIRSQSLRDYRVMKAWIASSAQHLSPSSNIYLFLFSGRKLTGTTTKKKLELLAAAFFNLHHVSSKSVHLSHGTQTNSWRIHLALWRCLILSTQSQGFFFWLLDSLSRIDWVQKNHPQKEKHADRILHLCPLSV
jgi:hypothetical protein